MNIVSSRPKKERQRPPVTRDTHARNRPANYIYIKAHIYRQHTTGDWKMLRRIFLSTVDFSEKQQQLMAKKKKKKTFNRAHFATCSLFLKNSSNKSFAFYDWMAKDNHIKFSSSQQKKKKRYIQQNVFFSWRKKEKRKHLNLDVFIKVWSVGADDRN